ncbi:MAG: phosphotransferase enzyme family protein [Terracidiphilus sp.]
MTKMAMAHGMDGTLVEPDWPPLTLDEVRALLCRFPCCGEPIRILSVSPRPFSAASVAAAAGQRVFIKRHHKAVRDREGLLEEHRFLGYLHARGASVPQVLADASGETAIESGEWTYEVHQAPAEADLYEDALSWTPFASAAHARSAGRMLARLHRSAQGFAAPPRRPRPLVAGFTIFSSARPGAALQDYLAARPALGNFLSGSEACGKALDLLAPFHARFLPLAPSLASLWTHNDLHASNLLWSGDGPDAQATMVIDFGLAERTHAVHDLAVAIERNIVEWLALAEHSARPEEVPVHLDHLMALLNGYQQVSPLAEEEAAALAPVTALCHAEFALSEADYFLRVLRSEEKARVAVEDYLLGHARWFRSAGGCRLLDAIDRWVERRRTAAEPVGAEEQCTG